MPMRSAASRMLRHTLTATRPSPSRRRSLAKPQESIAVGREVLSERLFRDVFLREGKRTHRSAGLLALLLVEASEAVPAASPAWETVVDAIKTATRDTDVMGWLEQDGLLGVVLTEITSRNAQVVRGIEARVQRELSKRMSPAAIASLSLRVHVHYELEGPAEREHEHEIAPVDPLLRNLSTASLHVRAHRVLKRALDIAASLAFLVALAPVFAVVAALVRLTSKGPIFFRQERIGEMARPFKMVKFRTMFTGSDSAIHQAFVTQFITSGAQSEPVKDAPFKIANDPRITPIGRFLRKTSLDELPQFWNVLRGEMSLVGPRPPLAYEVAKYQQWHCRRVLEAKPGITGLWQVTGRSRTTFDEMVRLDLRYAKKRSVWNDIRILLATPAAVVGGKGAA
jgi:lipopolysaccharide/colanic/teichoic acid biosynthesis glycosyltransferase